MLNRYETVYFTTAIFQGYALQKISQK